MMDAFARAVRMKAMFRLHEYQTEFSPERTLVIIDMQDLFINEDEMEIIPNIITLIKHAMENKWAIIVVEYDWSGATNVKITQALGEYLHQETVVKHNCDGGKEIIDCIESRPTWSTNLLVCGVYGPECVAQTVAGLIERSDVVEIDVVIDAVCPEYKSCNEHEQAERIVTMRELGISTIEGSVV